MFDFVKNFFKAESSSFDDSLVLSNQCSSSALAFSNVDLVLQNASVNRSLSLIASSISTLDLVVLKNGESDFSSVVYRTLFNPSDSFSFSDFIETFVWNFLISGNSYILLEPLNTSTFSLVNLPPSSVSIFLNKNKSKVAGYSYSPSSLVQPLFFSNASFPFLGHFKNFNPRNPWYGYSLIDPVASSAKLYQHIDRHNLAVISNGGRPSGVLSISPSKMLTSEEKRDFAQKFKEQNAGPDNAGQIFVLNGDCQWHQFSGAVKDMDYSDAARRAIRSIASGLGVPPNLVGDLSLSGENSRSNMDSLLHIFNKTTVLPLANRISQFLTLFFRKHLDPEVTVQLVEKASLDALKSRGGADFSESS